MKLISINKKAFTLIDLLIYIAILSSVILVMSSLFSLSIRQREKADTINKVNSDIYRTSQVITEEIKNADGIVAPLVGATGPQVTTVNNAVQSRFYLSNGNLLMDKSGQTFQINSNYITVNSLSVQNLSTTAKDESVQIKITYSFRNLNGIRENSYSNSYQFTISLNE